VQRDLGPLYQFLPEGALEHDPNAYLKSEQGAEPVSLGRGQLVN
jgi:hypothetical protein